ncbi:D-xylulose reductase [Paenibacillus solanacearum]|uniref:D-xylulose reductase n=1 Tax=Paenibacillus solanacearum TaxID=2048548 RepID=A0A916JZ10_9BACL|nr:zinc-binding alcohol dehydrogenase [Paenibacillus solanacearum]CAG7617234.1 D-xylulose reductase [Paenibacillus solanacearum]
MRVVVTQAGTVHTADYPDPELLPGHILVQTRCSAISPGTEMTAQRRKPEHPVVLGYSAMGVVQEVGEGVRHIQKGQRVACYGGPYVRHAETLLVPKHLAVPLEDHVDSGEAAFVGLGAIAIHALRQAGLQFGETVVVVGLGIVGQLVCQIANAASYRVIGFDLIESRCAKWESSGSAKACRSLQEVEAAVREATHNAGADAVIVCAGSKERGLIDSGLDWLRDRGSLVVVGDLKLEFDRERMFRKEAKLLISRAGGPGRYDRSYEKDGVDYPIGFVRWTEGRNMQEYVRLLSEGRLHVGSLITGRYPLHRIAEAYEQYAHCPQETLGLLVDYS